MNLLIIAFIAIKIFTPLSTNNFKVLAETSTSFAKCRMPSFEEAYQESKAIFVGKVLSERKEGDDKIFKIRVEKYWKGKQSKIVEVSYYETMRYQAWFQVGGRYLVYARGNDDGTLSDGRCSQTKKYSEAKDDLKKLGKGKIVKK